MIFDDFDFDPTDAKEPFKKKLWYYVLGYCTTEADIIDNDNNRMFWRCQAEDYEHAVEQLKDAEPTMNWCELFKTEGPH